MVTEQEITRTKEELFIELYETVFPKVAAFIQKMGGNLDETKDIFQDALISFYEKKAGNTLVVQTDEKAYLFGICKHLWYKTHTEQSKKAAPDFAFNMSLQDDLQPVISKDLLFFVERSGKKCLELLKAFYYDKINMKAIADKFKFSGERSATAQKYKCLEKVRTAIRNKSLVKEDFYE